MDPALHFSFSTFRSNGNRFLRWGEGEFDRQVSVCAKLGTFRRGEVMAAKTQQVILMF